MCRAYVKTVKNDFFYRNCPVKMTLKLFYLATFCCYDHGAKISEEV